MTLTPSQEGIPDWNRILSGGLCLLWLVLCGLGGGVAGVFKGLATLVVPIACIWFPDELGQVTTMFPTLGGMPITRGSPGCAVRVFGWVALLALTVVRVVIVAALAPR